MYIININYDLWGSSGGGPPAKQGLGTRSSFCAHGAAPRKGTFLNKLLKNKKKSNKNVVFLK